MAGVNLLLPTRCQREQILRSAGWRGRGKGAAAPAASASGKRALGAQPSPCFTRLGRFSFAGQVLQMTMEQWNSFMEEGTGISTASASLGAYN